MNTVEIRIHKQLVIHDELYNNLYIVSQPRDELIGASIVLRLREKQ